MSERGSFATEFIYCPDCFQHAGEVLSKYFSSDVTSVLGARGLGAESSGLWAGVVKSSYGGAEIHMFGDINVDLEDVICHPLRIAVMAENGDNMQFSLLPIAHIQATTPPNTIPIFPAKVDRDWLGLAPGESLELSMPAPSGLLEVSPLVLDDEASPEDACLHEASMLCVERASILNTSHQPAGYQVFVERFCPQCHEFLHLGPGNEVDRIEDVVAIALKAGLHTGTMAQRKRWAAVEKEGQNG